MAANPERRTKNGCTERAASGGDSRRSRVGKSRLVWELREWFLRQERLYRLDVVQYDHSERLPSHGLNALIRSRFNLPYLMNEENVFTRLKEQMRQENPGVEAGGKSWPQNSFPLCWASRNPTHTSKAWMGKANGKARLWK